MASENSLDMVHDIGTLSDNVVRKVHRPYKCTFCIKTFTVHSNLIKHTRTHTGERPFKCEVCERAFANPSNLTRHRRLHTGIRPYTCAFCQKGFRDSSNLKYHLKTHLNDTSFKCQQCGDVFSVFSDYCAHMKVHFDITSELLYNSYLPSSHTKAIAAQTDALTNDPEATNKLISSSSFPSFTSSNVETNEEIWRMSSLAAASIDSDVQSYINSCDIASVNKSLVNGHQTFPSFNIENKIVQSNVDSDSIVPSLEPITISKDFNSSASQVDQELNLLAVSPLPRDLMSSKTKSAVELVDLDEVLLTKQDTQINLSEETEAVNKYSLMPSASGDKNWNLFSIKDAQLDFVTFEPSYEKQKSPVFQFNQLDQPEEIELRDDSTCTLDELANKLTQCTYCERIFTLEDASKQLGSEKPYCGTCDKLSANRIHQTTAEPDLQRKNICVLCDTLFEEPGQLKQHICVTNINGKRYNPFLKSPSSTDSNANDNFKESDNCKSDFVVHYEDPLTEIKVLEPSSCESQNLMTNTLAEKVEKAQDILFNEIKQIELKESNMESAEPDENEDDNEVIIVEKVCRTSGREDDKINIKIGKCMSSELIQSSPVEMNILQNDNLCNKNVFIIDAQADLIPSKSGDLVTEPVALSSSKNSLTMKNYKDHGTCAGKKNFNTRFPAKSKVTRTVLNKRRKLIENRLKKPFQQSLSKEEAKPSLFRSSHDLRFKCRYCDKAFSIQGNLIKHIRIHTGEKPFKCDFCTAAFANPSNLTRHIRTHTGEKPYKCLHCERRFRASSNMRSHQHTHFKHPPYKCNVCLEKFSLVSRYRWHLKSHHNRGLNNVRTNTNNVSGTQVNAEKLNNQITSLLSHKQNQKSTTFTIASNDDNSTSVSSVSNHSLGVGIHENQFLQNLNSEKEDSSLVQTDLWQENLKSDDQNSKEINNIIVINLENNSLDSYGPTDSDATVVLPATLLNEHLSENKMFSCKVSESRPFENLHKSNKTSTLFTNNFNLQLSNEISSDQTKLQNSKSPQRISFKSLSSSTVSKSRPYRCVYCSKGFTVHCNLVKHIRIHTGEKPFACQDCGKAFANPSNLTRHLRTHTGERPYKCSLCSCTFRSSSNLKIHMNSHSSTTHQIKCSFCDRVFIQNREFKIHLKTHMAGKKIKGHSSNLNSTKTNLGKSFNGGRIFSSSTMIPSFLRLKNPLGFTKQSLTLKNPITSRTALPHKQKTLKNATFITTSSNNNQVTLDTFQADSSAISSNATLKCQAERSQNGKENSSKIESFDSKVKEISLQHVTDAITSNKISNYNVKSKSSNTASDTVILNNEDAPNRLLTAKHKFTNLQISTDLNCVQIGKESCLNKPPQNNALAHCLEQNVTSQLEKNENGKIPSLSLAGNKQNSQEKINLVHSPKIKFEKKNLLSILETADSVETTVNSTSTATMSIRTSKLHKCKYCGRVFPSRCNLIKHVRTHTGEKPFRCKCCRAAFANPSNLTRHVRTHTGEKPYSCSHCSKTFGASSNLKQHLRTHREGSPYKCRYCSKTFFMFSNFKLHMCSHGNPGTNLKMSSDLESSSSLPTSSQKYFQSKSSTFLDKYNSNYNSMPRHSISSQQTILKSPQEGEMIHFKHKEASQTLDILNRKEQLSQSSNMNDMNYCNSAYTVKFAASIEDVGENKDSLVCKPINYSCRNTEQNVMPVFSGAQTTSKSVSDSNLSNQIQWPESNTRPDLIVVPTFRRKQKKTIYKCVYCEKTFTVSSNLTKHVRTHTGEKPFQCRFCTKAFANPSNLIRHERIHTGERPYQCPYCPQRFAASGNLKEHVKKHNSSSSDDLLFYLQSLSKMVVMKRKQKTVKEKYSGINYKNNFNKLAATAEQTLSPLSHLLSISTKDSNNFSIEDNSKNEGNQFMEVANQLDILDNSFEKGANSRINVPLSDSKTSSSAFNRNEELSVFSFDSLIFNSVRKPGSVSPNEIHIKQELAQEKDSASSDDFSSQTVEINNRGQEIVKEECKENQDKQKLRNSIYAQNDLLALFKSNSMNPLNDEKSSNPLEISEITQSIDSILCKKEFPNSVSSMQNSFENTFSQPNEEVLHQCQVCHLTFVHSYEFNKHMEIHELSHRTKDKVSNNEEFSKTFLTDSRENSSENTDNENASFMKGELYICKYGCQTFGSYIELNSHLKIHAEDKALINTICINDDNFQQNNSQQENSLSAHSLNTQPQQAAAAVPPSLTELDVYGCSPFMSLNSNQHLMVEHTQPNISRTKSSVSLSQSQPEIFKDISVMWHTKNLQKPHHCPFCIKSFSKRSQLTKHIRTHTGETPHKCRYCGTGFANPSNLTRHIRTHTGEKPYQCPICKKAFGNSSNMKEHLKTHSKTSLYKCKYCKKKFSIFNTYRMHLKSHYKFLRTAETNKKGESPISIICDNNSNSSEEIMELSKQTNDKTLFSISTNTLKYQRDKLNFNVSDLNVNNANEVCEIIKLNDATSSNCHSNVCLADTAETSQVLNETTSHYQPAGNQKQSEQLINLVDFYQIFSPSSKDTKSSPNENPKLSKVNQSKAFTHSQPLRSHICSYCEKSFTIHSNLTKHIRTHTGEKPFKCHTCDAAFANPSNLTRHVRTHTGEKPYLCPHCSKSFRASSNLKVHLKMIHTQY